jgi:uncharacterized protein
MSGHVVDLHLAGRPSHLGRTSLAALLRRHPVVAFFVLAYGVSWVTLLVLYGVLGLPAALVILLQTLGPTVAALAMAGVLEGPAGRRRLLAQVRIWRVARRWYLFALVGVPAACLAAALVVPGAFVGLADQSAVALGLSFVAIVVVGFVSGPLFEEPGWRGFALPRLQTQMGALPGTLVLGALWAGWHLPQYLMPEWAAQNGGLDPVLVATFLLMVIAISPIMTWMFNRTRGSLFLVMLAHASINAALTVFVVAASALDVGLLACGAVSVVLIVVTRGRLGYAPLDAGA